MVSKLNTTSFLEIVWMITIIKLRMVVSIFIKCKGSNYERCRFIILIELWWLTQSIRDFLLLLLLPCIHIRYVVVSANRFLYKLQVSFGGWHILGSMPDSRLWFRAGRQMVAFIPASLQHWLPERFGWWPVSLKRAWKQKRLTYKKRTHECHMDKEDNHRFSLTEDDNF